MAALAAANASAAAVSGVITQPEVRRQLVEQMNSRSNAMFAALNAVVRNAVLALPDVVSDLVAAYAYAPHVSDADVKFLLGSFTAPSVDWCRRTDGRATTLVRGTSDDFVCGDAWPGPEGRFYCVLHEGYNLIGSLYYTRKDDGRTTEALRLFETVIWGRSSKTEQRVLIERVSQFELVLAQTQTPLSVAHFVELSRPPA